jgi:hypothetical protein
MIANPLVTEDVIMICGEQGGEDSYFCNRYKEWKNHELMGDRNYEMSFPLLREEHKRFLTSNHGKSVL